MNTPLILTSVGLLAGAVARPINRDNIPPGDQPNELVNSPNYDDDRQVFLGANPPALDSVNSLQLHDVYGSEGLRAVEGDVTGSVSPKLTRVDVLSDPDPGLDSPYAGPQRQLSGMKQELEEVTSSSSPSPHSSATSQVKESQPSDGAGPNYSPMVVPLVFASLVALVLLTITIVVVYIMKVLQHTLLHYDVLKKIAKQKELSRSENEKVVFTDAKRIDVQATIAAREVPGDPVPVPTLDTMNSSDAYVEDPGLMALPKDLPEVHTSVPTVHRNHALGMRLVAWTYDNWITHFMIALFGWFSIFSGGIRVNGSH